MLLAGIDIDTPLVQMACRNLAKEHVAATERLAEARRQGGTPTAEARAVRALKKVWFEQVNATATSQRLLLLRHVVCPGSCLQSRHIWVPHTVRLC